MASNVDYYSLFGCQFNNISLYLKYSYPLTYQFYFQMYKNICKEVCYRIVYNSRRLDIQNSLVKEPVHDIKQYQNINQCVVFFIQIVLRKKKKKSAEIKSSILSDIVDIFWCKLLISLSMGIGNKQFVVCEYALNSSVLEDAGYKNNIQTNTWKGTCITWKGTCIRIATLGVEVEYLTGDTLIHFFLKFFSCLNHLKN